MNFIFVIYTMSPVGDNKLVTMNYIPATPFISITKKSQVQDFVKECVCNMGGSEDEWVRSNTNVFTRNKTLYPGDKFKIPSRVLCEASKNVIEKGYGRDNTIEYSDVTNDSYEEYVKNKVEYKAVRTSFDNDIVRMTMTHCD
jgi:hypothetical protein